MTQPPDGSQDVFAGALGAPDQAIGFVLWRLVHRYQRELDRVLAPLDLTHLQFQTLALAAWMTRLGGSASQVQVARAGALHPMQASHMLKALEAKRLVARRRDPADSRIKTVTVEPEGLEALRAALPLAIAVQRRLFGEDGRPGGPLLATLQALERSWPAEDP